MSHPSNISLVQDSACERKDQDWLANYNRICVGMCSWANIDNIKKRVALQINRSATMSHTCIVMRCRSCSYGGTKQYGVGAPEPLHGHENPGPTPERLKKLVKSTRSRR
ncbi:hypothetical protein PMIN06_001912 [Paraphaeosphaeria minitans]|uniref:Transaldolase b n=1 Tax=Paraphaeosphaeria minitans TaxID=565426 RepID=A0A9P6GK59_9PLEO|nr:transaldolase b [Paraphaeosphaeria minitans]